MATVGHSANLAEKVMALSFKCLRMNFLFPVHDKINFVTPDCT